MEHNPTIIIMTRGNFTSCSHQNYHGLGEFNNLRKCASTNTFQWWSMITLTATSLLKYVLHTCHTCSYTHNDDYFPFDLPPALTHKRRLVCALHTTINPFQSHLILSKTQHYQNINVVWCMYCPGIQLVHVWVEQYLH